MGLVTENVTLVDAIASFSNLPHRDSAREFLEGLSTDELEYIAAYLGACTLDPELHGSSGSRDRLAAQIERYERGHRSSYRPKSYHGSGPCTATLTDVSHKMILLLEFLSITTLSRPAAWPVHIGSA